MAEQVYQQNDDLRTYKNNLDITVKWYNKIVQSTIEVRRFSQVLLNECNTEELFAGFRSSGL